MSVLKVDDLTWEMPTYAGEPPSIRRLRVWETKDGATLAVITETGEGTPVTDVAAAAYAAVRESFPQARVFEHYPESRDEPETLDEISVVDGAPTWSRVTPEAVDPAWLPLHEQLPRTS